MTFANVDGDNIKYTEYGKNEGNTILFIHGLGSSSLVWRDIPEALSEHFHTISLDLIGFGLSAKPKMDYTISFFSQFIKRFLIHIGVGLNNRLSIIGHSLGGYIAMQFAIDNKNWIDKLVLIDSSGMLREPTPLLNQYLDAAMETDNILRYRKVNRIFEDLLAERSRLLPILCDIFIGTIEKEGAKHAFASAFYNSTTKSIDLNRIKEIDSIPCLIIWGVKDSLIPVSHFTKFQNVLRNAKFVLVDDAGHSPFVEKTAIVYEKLHSFFLDT